MAEEFLLNEEGDSDTSNGSQTLPERERIKHFLVGSPGAVRRVVQQLHKLGYAEVGAWSKPQAAGELGQSGEVVSVLIRFLLQ